MKNRQFLLAARPVGLPTRDNWEFAQSDVPELGDNQVLIKIVFRRVVQVLSAFLPLIIK